MGQKQFRKHILVSILFQISFISFLMVSLYFAKESGLGSEGYLIMTGVGMVAFIICSKFFYKSQVIEERFKEVYPEKKLSRNFVTFTIFFPIYFLVMVLILCFKDPSEKNEASSFFTYRWAIPSAVLLLMLQYFLTPVAYLTALPSIYFIKKTMDDSSQIFRMVPSPGHSATVLEDYKKRFNSKLSSTEIVLLTAQTLKNIAGEKRSTASEGEDKKILKFRKALTVINQMQKILDESNSFKLRPVDYSPVQWIHPRAPVEILLISSVELLILKRFNKTVCGKMDTIIAELEKNIELIPEKEQEGLRKQLSEAKITLKKVSGS